MTSGTLSAAWCQPDYYTLKVHGKPIGQISIEHYALAATQDGPDGQNGKTSGNITEIRNTNQATREGLPFGLNEVSRFVEDPKNGQPVSFSYAYHLGEQDLLEAEGQLHGNALDLSLQRNNTVTQNQAPIASERFLFPDGEKMRQIYRQHFRDPLGSRFAFQTLSLGVQPQIVNSEVISGKREKLKLDNGKRQAVRQFVIQNPANPQNSFHEWRDADGKLYKATSDSTEDMEMVLASVADDSRLDNLDVITTSAVISNKISQPRITTDALYRLSPIHGQSIDWSNTIPAGGQQSIQKLADNQLYLHVIQKLPTDSSIELPVDGPAQYLQSTPYVQANDPDINRVALDNIGKEKRAYFAARILKQWVYENIAQKDLSLGFASAKDTLLSQQGDCTEHAVLLAALTRSVGIPSRVAIGLIYLPNGGESQAGRFVYHMWTEIYLGNMDHGEWIPMDATRPEPMTDATHIKIADSALTDASDLINLTHHVTDIMGRMKIDVLKAMSLSQSVLDMEAAPDITATALQKMDIQEIDIQNLSKKAIQHYRVELPPAAMSKESPDGLFTYGVEALNKGNYDDAMADFRQALDKQRNPLALYRLGERLAGIEMYGLAQEAFQRASDKDSNLSGLTSAWASSYLPKQSLPDDLNQQFMQAISEPGQPANPVMLQMVTAQATYFAPAYRHLGEESTGSEAINALQRAMAIAPEDFRNAESLGDAYMKQGRYSAALQVYRTAIDTLKRNAAFMQSKPEWRMMLEGKQEMAKGSAALAGNKGNASGWLTLGNGLLLQQRQDEAELAFNNALALNSGSAEAQIRSFQMALHDADWPSIFAQKDGIAGLSNSHAQAASLLGLYQMRSRQYGPAVSSLHKAIAMAPTDGEAYRTLAQTYLRMADLADDQPGPQGRSASKRLTLQAQDALRRGSRCAGSMVERHSLAVQLAKLLITSGQPEAAIPLADGILAVNPIDGSALAAKGKAQAILGQNEAAKDTLENALTLNPNDSDILLSIGMVAQDEGRDALALESYQKAYKADPFNQSAANAVRSMMKQLHIAGSQPPQYWFLSADEHDYIVQLLYQGKQLTRQTLSYLRLLKALPGRAGRIEYSAKGIAAAQQLQTSLQQLRQNTLHLAQSLQSNRVPARFAGLNREFQDAVAKQLLALDNGIQSGSTLDHSSPNVPVASYAQLLFSINQTQKPIDDLLDKLDDNLPDPVLDGMMAEAQMDDYFDMKDESGTITKTLLSRKEKDPPRGDSAANFKQNARDLMNAMKAMPGMPTVPGMPVPQLTGNNTGKLAPPNLPANFQLPPGLTPNAIKNISLPGLPPNAFKPATNNHP